MHRPSCRRLARQAEVVNVLLERLFQGTQEGGPQSTSIGNDSLPDWLSPLVNFGLLILVPAGMGGEGGISSPSRLLAPMLH